jgi:hypothetical protein
MKPDLSRFKVFGSRVCVKQPGTRAGKLDRNDFTGIFLGYCATTQNIQYIDLTSGIVKTNHHADFDEAWYLQPSRPPAAQLLYDLGLEPNDDPIDDTIEPHPPETTTSITQDNLETLRYVVWHPPIIWRHQPIHLVTTHVPWPPMKSLAKSSSWTVPPTCRLSPLPLREITIPPLTDRHHQPRTAAAAMLQANSPDTTPTESTFDAISLRPTIMRSKGRTCLGTSIRVHDFEKGYRPNIHVPMPVLRRLRGGTQSPQI